MTSQTAIQDIDLIPLAREFARELRRLHQRMAWGDYTESNLVLQVTIHGQSAKAEVQIITGKGYPRVQVTGASLGVVMDETYRRLDYQDREDGRIATSLQALPGPESTGQDDGEIQF